MTCNYHLASLACKKIQIYSYYCAICHNLLLQYRVNHSKNAIVKPQAKHPDAAQRELDETMKKVMEAQQLIDTAIEPRMTLYVWVCICDMTCLI